MSPRTVRVRTWRRILRALAHPGRAREALSEAGFRSHRDEQARRVMIVPPGPGTDTLREDRSTLAPLRRPQQGRLGDCWVLAPMLAIFETAPERLAALFEPEADGIVRVRLPAAPHPVRVDRCLPVDAAGRFVYARQAGRAPGWAGVLEKAIAAQIAGDYGILQRGFARYGLELLLGTRGRTLLRLPDAAQIERWRAQSRAITASTHPLSRLVPTSQGPLAANHVYAVVGAEMSSGHVHLRNPVRPDRVLTVDARTFRRGFLSVDVSVPLR